MKKPSDPTGKPARMPKPPKPPKPRKSPRPDGDPAPAIQDDTAERRAAAAAYLESERTAARAGLDISAIGKKAPDPR
jgi:hypothetical protein